MHPPTRPEDQPGTRSNVGVAEGRGLWLGHDPVLDDVGRERDHPERGGRHPTGQERHQRVGQSGGGGGQSEGVGVGVGGIC